MPESANEHLDVLEDLIRKKPPAAILDVGMGRGNYGWFLRERVKFAGQLFGLEVWAPYVVGEDALAGANRRFYDRIEVGDIRQRERVVKSLGVDTIFAFDVIEHMIKPEGIFVMRMLRECCKQLLVSVPIVPYSQGPLHGNPYEEHKHDWTIEQMHEQGGVLLNKGALTGLFTFDSVADSGARS